MTKPPIGVVPLEPELVDAWIGMRTSLWPDCPEQESRLEANAYFAGGDLRMVLMAFADEEPIGFAEISERNIVDGCPGGPAAYLEGWYVEPEFRQQGVGRTLIDAAMTWARETGYSHMGSDVELDNQISREAHEKLGFEDSGKVVRYARSLSV